VLCIVDLPNINFLATGDYEAKIILWDLKANSYEDQIEKIKKDVARLERQK
jgi:hypothetical protein